MAMQPFKYNNPDKPGNHGNHGKPGKPGNPYSPSSRGQIVRRRLSFPLLTCLAFLMVVSFVLSGCFMSKPVVMSPAFKTQAVTASQIIGELERRYSDPNVPIDREECVRALGLAKKTIQEIVEASE